ncbi:hypothetical protein [Spirosoma spitsbergense]|jgi:hypothetical protein|uniref:hypothetical protein n=1 Tax=Spirosoma spitsbergense TaxID=431554 RepID=UPI0003817146|nr:hypothetical protein [Spirosoma spitsbergense]
MATFADSVKPGTAFGDNDGEIDEYSVMNRLFCSDGQELYNLITRLKTDTRVSTIRKATRTDTV